MGTISCDIIVIYIIISSPTSYSESLSSDSDIEHEVDWWGTLVISDSNTAGHKTVEISYPSTQVYAQIYVGEEDSVVSSAGTTTTGATSLGEVVVKDSEVSSVSSKNLIIIGGSCINSAAASLVGGAHCGAAWTDATGIGSGEFLIKGYSDSSLAAGKLALLVAGFDSADTVNAAVYLRNLKPDTSAEYKGTSATSAEMIVTGA